MEHDLLTGVAARQATRADGDLPVLDQDVAVKVPSALRSRREVRLGVIAHVFYPDFASTLASVMSRLPPSARLYVSTDTQAKAEQIRATLADHGARLDCRITPNRGRDIAPRLIAFADVFDACDLVLMLHSKKSLHDPELEGWGDFLVHHLAGSRDIADSIIGFFEADDRLGMVGAQHFPPIRRWCVWTNDLAGCKVLGRRLGVRITRYSRLDFPSGSMFWARPQALRPLLDLRLGWEEFPDEQGQIDGTLAHAIERLLYYCCEAAGYRWLKVADPALFPRTGPIVEVNDATALHRFLARRADLLGLRWPWLRMRATSFKPGASMMMLRRLLGIAPT
ncbi:MAG: rhamnan synthesis F family protein [Alsobacter sp.]